MKQKVHSVSYLAKAEFELNNGAYDLVALPAGAEVVKVSLEVVGNPTDGTIDVGFRDEKDESTRDYFLTSDSTLLVNKTATSTKDYTATINKVIVAVVRSVSSNNGAKGVLRVLYFLPSVIEVEY
ncbi:hypothetical protein [Helicobacter pylori]|uniref:hypothetical protein n=1 Tax=Helicobacter pylori TaxID=210 RepID=UPI0012B2E513|nr:hypothetical protein [Helicobacter pylori]